VARHCPDHVRLDGLVFPGLPDGLVENGTLPVRQAAWHPKTDAAFSDMRAFVRRAIWALKHIINSESGGERLELSPRDCMVLLSQPAATA